MLCTPLYTLIYKIAHIASKGKGKEFVIRPLLFVSG
jgi:hypothetical protein